MFIGSDLYVANCGDARAVMCRDGNAVRLSVDHKPDDPLERKRIRELGGYVSYTGRILDDILVARSLGDAQSRNQILNFFVTFFVKIESFLRYRQTLCHF